MRGIFALLNLAIIAGTTLSAQQSSSVPNCAVGNAPGQAYVDETLDQLKKNVPSLRGISPEATQSKNATASAAPAQDQADSILGQAGTTLAELRHRIPNLIAKEEVIEEIQSVDNVDKRSYSAFSSLMAPPSMGPSMGLEGSPSGSNRTSVYGYRIAPRADSTFGDAFDEFRTDSHNHRIADATDDPHNPHTMGFATSWLIFSP